MINESNHLNDLNERIQKFTDTHVFNEVTELKNSGKLDYDSHSQFHKQDNLLARDRMLGSGNAQRDISFANS